MGAERAGPKLDLDLTLFAFPAYCLGVAYLAVALGSLALLVWTAFQIGSPRVSAAVSDVAGIVGALFMLALLP